MTPDTKAALEALQRRLTHAWAIAGVIAPHLDGQNSDAVAGIEQMLMDCGDQLDRIINDKD